MDELLAFLRERLNEDERLASAASPGPWHSDAEAQEVLAVDGITVADGFALSDAQLRATVEHIARHDPARVLREVEAKRRIVEQWATHEALDRETFEAEGEHARSLVSLRAAYWDACRDLAAVYADHPDYRPEWATV